MLSDDVAAAEHLALPRIRRPPGRPFGDALRTARRLWTRAWTRCVALAPVGFAARLGLAASALILITCIAEAWILARGERERVAQYLSDRGRAISEQLAREAGPGVAAGKTQDLRQLAEQARVQRGLAYTRFFDRQGLLLASVGALPPGLAHPEVTPRAQTVGPMPIGGQLWEFHAPIFAPDGLATPAKTAQSRGRGASKFVHALEPVGTVAIGLQLEPLAAIQRRTVTTGSIVAALFTLAAVLTAIGLARHITRPLQALVGAADRIASGDLEARVAIATRDEVGNLGRHFNAMVESLGRSRAMLESYSRALEEKVEELEKANEVKSEFMATISHELRTPLNVIIGYTEMLADGAGGPLSEVQTGMLKAIQEYSQVQLALITNVLDFSRLSAGRVSFQIERFELAPLVEDVVTTYAKRVGDRPLRVSAAVAPDLPTLETDRRKVEEILRSLLDNALKFTERGTVSVVAKSGADGGSVVIEVEDTGPGIAAEEVSCLFDPFRQIGKSSTRRTGGLGLGLSIVKHLAEALGGAVSVSSRLGEGSTFRIEVPCALHGDGTALDADAPVIAVAALDVVSRRSEPRPLPTPARTAKAARP